MTELPESRTALGEPDPERAPIVRNVFDHARNGFAQLLPMFPNLSAGAMVPAVALLNGGVPWGRFFHKNDVDEVTVCWGSVGGVLQTGSIQVGGRMHGVDSFLRSPNDPESFMLLVITQKQSDQPDRQAEAILFRCTECNHKLFELEYSETSSPGSSKWEESWPGRQGDPMGVFTTQWGSWAAACAFNESDELRKCEKCGHQNGEFPVDSWGWRSYVERHAYVSQAYRTFPKEKAH